MKTAFLILGAQRSGTSVTSHIFSRFGVNFGREEEFLQAEHNPIFFELNWVNRLNNQLINCLGYQYTDFFLPSEKDFEEADTQAFEAELQRCIEQEWHGSPLLGIQRSSSFSYLSCLEEDIN